MGEVRAIDATSGQGANLLPALARVSFVRSLRTLKLLLTRL